MLGTNDAKTTASGGPSNWGCGVGSNVTVSSCQFAQDYLDFIKVVQGLGPSPSTPPVIYLAVPPPLMQHGSIGGALRPYLYRFRHTPPHPPAH